MKSVDQHLADVLGTIQPLGTLQLTIDDAHGCVLAEDVLAASAQPPFDMSVLAGYAVRSSDVAAATPAEPTRLPVVGDVGVGGSGAVSVQPGFCVKVTAGAPVPPGADAVVPLQWTDGGLATVSIAHPVGAGYYVRKAGQELAAGTTVLPRGAHLGATQVGLLAAVGRSTVHVQPRPRVVVVTTGSNLRQPGETLQQGQVYDANSHSLTAAAREAGGTPYRVGVIPDDPRRLLDTLEDHLIRADVLILSGSDSGGSFAMVQEVLSRLGTVSFAPIAMDPGSTQGFGTIGPDSVPIFMLPGQPAAALISFEVFVRPALRRMLGVDSIHRPSVQAQLAGPLSSAAGARQFVRARVERRDGVVVAVPVGAEAASVLASLATANALVVVPEDVTDLPAGAPVTALLLERRSR